ncbi:MAG: hydroxypyruvate isomerase family protein [Tepidisphaeraceae bacterium]
MRIKQSFCYPLFRPEGMGLDELFGAAASIGYAGVEFWTRGPDFDDVVATAKRHRLVIASMVGHASLADGLNHPANHDRIEAELRESIDVAARNGIPSLICFSGNRRDGQTDDDAIDATATGLRRAAPHAEAKGVNLNLELLNSKLDHKGYQCDHTAWGAAVVRRVGSPRVKLLYDIYHMQIMEGDVIATIRAHVDVIGHVHTAGVPGRKDLDDEQELNYAAVCKAIASTGYNGYVGHEFWSRGDKLAALQKAYATCDRST